MLPDGRVDTSAAGGGLWKTQSRASMVHAVATSPSGAIVAAGVDGAAIVPAMFVVNPDGTTPPGFGPVGMVQLAETGFALGLCISGSRVVVPLLSPEQGFLLAGYKLQTLAPVTPVRRPAAPLSQSLRAAQQPPVRANRFAARAQGDAQKAAQQIAAMEAAHGWLDKSAENMGISSRMMGVHSMNMLRW